MSLEEQLVKLEQELTKIKPPPIIHHTERYKSRMRDIQDKAPWHGREIAMNQDMEV